MPVCHGGRNVSHSIVSLFMGWRRHLAQKVGVVPFSTLTLPLPKILRGLTKSHDKPSACGLVGKRFGEMGADKPQPPVHSHCGQHQRHLRFLLLRVGFVPLLDDGSKKTQIVSDRKGSVAFKREILVSEGLLPTPLLRCGGSPFGGSCNRGLLACSKVAIPSVAPCATTHKRTAEMRSRQRTTAYDGHVDEETWPTGVSRMGSGPLS